MANNEIIRLQQFASLPAVPVQEFSPGTYTFPLQTEGNSILSTLWIKAADPGSSVTVSYWDFGPGDGDLPSERINLQSHGTFAAALAPLSDRIIVTRLHNKPRVEVIVSAGNVTLGVYSSVVSNFPISFDEVTKLQAEDGDLLEDRGLPAMGYDSGLGKFFFLPMVGGKLDTTGTGGGGGGTDVSIAAPTIANISLVLANTEYSYALPALTKQFLIQNRGDGFLRLSYDVGESGTTFWTIWAGASKEITVLDPMASVTLYVQSNRAAQIVEVESWV